MCTFWSVGSNAWTRNASLITIPLSFTQEYVSAAYMLNNFDRSELESMGALQGLVRRGLLDKHVEPLPKTHVGLKGNCEACEFCIEPSCTRCHGCREGPSCFRKVCGPVFHADDIRSFAVTLVVTSRSPSACASRYPSRQKP